MPIQKLSAETESVRMVELKAYREGRDGTKTDVALNALTNAAEGTANLFPFVLDAFRAKATLGEVCGALRRVWGEYRG